MKSNFYCAFAVVSAMAVGCAHAGALKDFLSSKSANSQVGEKHEEETPATETTAEAAPADSSANAAEAPVTTEAPAATAAPKEKKKIVGDPVVLRINGKVEFRRSQILEEMKKVPVQMVQGIDPDKLFEMLRDQKANTYLMVSQAKKAGLDRTKEFLERLEMIKEELLGRELLVRELAPKADNEAALKTRYTKYLVEFKKEKETQLFHIMLSKKEDADAVLKALANGEDFSKLAREKSEAPSAQKGGEEGYVPLAVLPSQLKDPLMKLGAKGDYTREPVVIENRYHIFKIGDSRDSVPQKYEDAKPMLRQLIMHEEMKKLIQRLEKQAKVEKFNEDGTPLGVVSTPVKSN